MKNSIKILCIGFFNLCVVSFTAHAQLNESIGINIGFTRPSTSTIYGLNINKGLNATGGGAGSGYHTNIQIIDKDWSASHAILFNSYASNTQVNGGLATIGNTKYAHDLGPYSATAGSIMFFGHGGTLDFYISPLSTGAGNDISWGTPKLRILRDGNVGIGKTTPAYRLDVESDIATHARFVGSYSGIQGIQVERDGGDNIRLVTNYTNYGGGLESSSALRFAVNGNGIMAVF